MVRLGPEAERLDGTLISIEQAAARAGKLVVPVVQTEMVALRHADGRVQIGRAHV